jgi:nitroreductase
MTAVLHLPHRRAHTESPILDVLADRWSPRSFDTTAEVSVESLRTALEAARWSPSASNTQPWRFILVQRGTADFERVTSHLVGFNQDWAGSASFLLVAVAELSTSEGREQQWARYDLGQAVAHLSVQAHADGLHVHQMGGFDAEALRREFGLDERFAAVSVSAIGILASPDQLPEKLREREHAPRSRKPLDELVLVGGDLLAS